jgi:hypothetical protein
MSGTVTIHLDLFQDPHYWDLTPTQRAALPLLVGLMEQFGEDGVLDLSRKAIWRHVNLGPKSYGDLLEKMDKWGWGCETEQGRLVLCGTLAPAASVGALAMVGGTDIQHIIAKAVAAAIAAAMPAAIAAAIPAAIRQHQAETKQQQRANKQQGAGENVQDKPTSEGANVQDNEAEKGGDVLDNADPSRTHAESIDSIRVDIDSIKSYSSNDSIDSNRSIEERPEPVATIPPELVSADVAQMIVERSPNPDGTGRIEMPRAQALLEKYKAERCLQVLLLIPSFKPGKPGAFIEAALLNKQGKYPVPAEIVAEAKRRLSPSVPKQPRRSVSPPAPSAEVSGQDNVVARVWSFQQTMTPDEGRQIDEEAINRMGQKQQMEFRRLRSSGENPGNFLKAAFELARTAVLREWALRGSDGPNTPQGG